MPLYAGELNIRRGAPLAEFPAPLSEVLTAQRQQTRIESPMNALSRLNELQRAETGDVVDIGDPMEGRPSEYAPVTRLDAETARARVKEEGLPLTIPDDGIAEGALDILLKRKREELQRQNVMARGPGGVGAGAARLGVALFESLLDPLNIATAFVPVIGPARYAAMVGRAGGALGRAGVRARVGAVEGMAGAAIVEPLIYSAMQAEQADYDMSDSLANIAFGSVFGGGLHVGGGALRDVVQPGWWRMAERSTVPTAADPVALRALDAAPAVEASPVRAAEAVDALELGRRIADAESRPGFQRTADDLLVLRQDRTPEAERAAEILKQPAFERSAEDSVFLKALEKGREADYINERLSQTLRQMEAIDSRILSRGNSPEGEGAMLAKRELTQSLERDAARMAQLGRSPNEARLVMDRVAPETRQTALRAAVAQSVEGRAVDVDAVVRADPAGRVEPRDRTQSAAQVRAAAVRTQSPDAIRSAEPPRAAETPVKQDLASAQTELDNALTVTDELADALGVERSAVQAELKNYDAAIKRAESYAKALKAGAACGVA